MIQCESFHRSDAYELGESLLNQLSKTRKALLPNHPFDSKFECNYAFNWGVLLKSEDGGIFSESNFFYQNNFKFNFLEDKARDKISKHIKINLTDTNRNGDDFSVEIYYVNDREIICSDGLINKENSRNLLSNLNDARKLAVSLLDGIYNSDKPNWPKRHLDTKYECNYIFELDLLFNSGTQNHVAMLDCFYQKNHEFYQFDSLSSILNNTSANNQLTVEKKKSIDYLYSVTIHYLDNPNILCSHKQEQQNKDKSFDRNAVHNLAISLSDSISKSNSITHPSTHFDAKYDCNYVFTYYVVLHKSTTSLISYKYYQKNQQFYLSNSEIKLDKISPNNKVIVDKVIGKDIYTVTIYFLDDPSILCPGRSNQKYRSKLIKAG